MFQQRQKSLTPAKRLFTVLHLFQLAEGFRCFRHQSRLQTNPFFESQDIVLEPFQKSGFHDKARLPPISTKPISQTQLIPNSQSLVFQSLQPPAQPQDRHEESDLKESPTLYKLDNTRTSIIICISSDLPSRGAQGEAEDPAQEEQGPADEGAALIIPS